MPSGYGDLGCQGPAGRKERLLRRLALACHREERGDLDCQELAKQKERLLRRLASMCHREERGDLACSGLAKQKERLLRRLAMTDPLSSRETWRSRLFRVGRQKREIASQARNDKTNVAGSQ